MRCPQGLKPSNLADIMSGLKPRPPKEQATNLRGGILTFVRGTKG